MKTKSLFCLLLIFLLVQGCAGPNANQKVAILPNLHSFESSSCGEGKTIAMKVVDERASSNVGRRFGGNGVGGMITTEEGVASAIRAKIVEGLQQFKFVVVEFSPDASRSMQVEIRVIEYSAGNSTGGKGSTATGAALKVLCRNNGQTYENMYRASNEKRSVWVTSPKDNAILINDVVSETLDKIFQDKELLTFLSR